MSTSEISLGSHTTRLDTQTNNNHSINNDFIIEMEEINPVTKVALTQLKEVVPSSLLYGCSLQSTIVPNLLRLTFAGGLSEAGALWAGFRPNPIEIAMGSTVSGLGNAASTFYMWEKKSSHLSEARMMTDLPKVDARISALNANVTRLKECIQEIYSSIHPPTDPPKVEHKLSEVPPPFTNILINEPWKRNVYRLTTAGVFSVAGGLMGGFYPTIPGIVVGATLAAIGNMFSTYLAYEHDNEQKIKFTTEKLMPELVEILYQEELELYNLVKRIEELQPGLLVQYKPAKDGEVESILPEHKPEACCEVGGTKWSNGISVNIAGWMSGIGAAIAGFDPTPIGITTGSVIAAAANVLSTYLPWQNKNDREVERRVEEDFPILLQKINEIAVQRLTLNAYFDAYMNPIASAA